MAELVGGAALTSFFQVIFDRLASADILHYFQKRRFNENLVKKMKIMLISLNTVIDDAEYKQFTDPNVKAWLLELKDAAYDAEDILAEVNCEVYKLKMEADADTQTGGVIAKVRKLFNPSSDSSFDEEIESRMKQVLETLEFLGDRSVGLGLKQGVKDGAVGSVTKLQTTSLVDEIGIYGRNEDKETIIKGLLKDGHFSVMSIVGLGGLGKTTLAQLVYNDQRILSEFDMRVWVCVSDDFDVLRLTQTILNKIKESNDDTKDLDRLQNKLKDELSRKKCLVVLDDVWCADDARWEALKAPFTDGVAGSRILVTSRHENVALAACSDETYRPQQLSDDDGWLLFEKYAFRNSSRLADFDAEEIGRRIVARCKGMPLALRTIGSLLSTKSTRDEWNNILTSEMWNISHQNTFPFPALILSYHSLPSHLKQCFSYCSLFPKDYEFEKEELVLLWMAQDFLRDSQSNKLIEFGNECFQELVSRSFFQRSSADETLYVMHDILHDLAAFVSGEACFKQEVEDVQKIPDKTRHFSFVTYYGSREFKLPEHFQKNRKVRTFLHMTPDPCFFEWTSSGLIFDQLCECKSLRVLTLDGHLKITETPDFIKNLIHLRYLDLSWCRIKRLPDSVCLLYNLQTLKLDSCGSIELPATLHNLKNLRQLDLQYTMLKKIPPNLVELKNLQVWLTGFYVGKCGEPNVKQLGELNLRGKLSICRLQNVVCGMNASEANLKEKKHLEVLSFEWGINDNEDSQNERDVLENLQPHQNLKQLSVYGYGGMRFPNWFGDKTALVSIVSLRLDRCKYCFVLPSLGLLSSLKSLVIEGLDRIVDIGAEFFGSDSFVIPFKSLEILEFRVMKNWERWDCTTSPRAFPSLKQLEIRDCPKLEKNLPQQLPSLENLQISDCPEFYGICRNEVLLGKIEHTIYNNSIEELGIGECPDYLKQHYSSLRKIRIHSCGSLRAFQLDLFPTLQKLFLSSCKNLEIISVSGGSNHVSTSLEYCELDDLENLKSLPEPMNIFAPSLRILLIRNCPQSEPFPEGGLPSKLETLSIKGCPKVFGSRKKWGLQNLASLRSLEIWGDDVAESLPEPGLLPTSLTFLSIMECHKLKMLDYEGLSQLSSLKTLVLQDCPKLECLPREGLPSSISKLNIYGNCEEVQRRCQKPTGEDWPKIAHICHVDISPIHWG